jgi:hypothetical protein
MIFGAPNMFFRMRKMFFRMRKMFFRTRKTVFRTRKTVFRMRKKPAGILTGYPEIRCDTKRYCKSAESAFLSRYGIPETQRRNRF